MSNSGYYNQQDILVAMAKIITSGNTHNIYFGLKIIWCDYQLNVKVEETGSRM